VFSALQRQSKQIAEGFNGEVCMDPVCQISYMLKCE